LCTATPENATVIKFAKRATSVAEIMGSPKFALGVQDVRAGRGFCRDYDGWESTNDRWLYECADNGRGFVPRTIPLKIDGRIAPEALRLFRKHPVMRAAALFPGVPRGGSPSN
jgi:hypothetical protein